MALAPSTRLGPYEVIAPLGAGGMGEVYRARDTRLDRDVAIKVSAERFSERFGREAHAIAALNHANICYLYDDDLKEIAEFLTKVLGPGDAMNRTPAIQAAVPATVPRLMPTVVVTP
jgi:serine/threonine protein kinase